MGEERDSYEVRDETVRALVAGVRIAAERIKHRLPPHVDVNDVVSAGYLALAQALADWDEGAGGSFEDHVMKRASAAMVAALRTTKPPPMRDELDLPDIDAAARPVTWDTI